MVAKSPIPDISSTQASDLEIPLGADASTGSAGAVAVSSDALQPETKIANAKIGARCVIFILYVT